MTDRLTASTINDEQLDALYERLAKAEQEADASVAAAATLTALVGKRSERAERDAEKQARRAKIFETELRTLRAGLRANGADPTQLQNLWAQISLRNRQWREEKKRADQAEDLLRIAHDTSNRSEAERARAVQRAEAAERDAGIYHNRLTRLSEGYAEQMHRLETAEAAIARVRKLCELTIAHSVRVQAIDQARDTLATLDEPKEQ